MLVQSSGFMCKPIKILFGVLYPLAGTSKKSDVNVTTDCVQKPTKLSNPDGLDAL